MTENTSMQSMTDYEQKNSAEIQFAQVISRVITM